MKPVTNQDNISFFCSVKQDVIETVLEWYHTYKNGLYGYVYSILGSRADTDDVLQEVFISISGLGEKVYSIRHPKTYLYRAARNEALRVLKKRNGKPFSLELLEHDPASPGSGEETIIAKDMAEHILSQLKPTDREIIVLHIYEGMSFREIAAATGRFLPSIATRYYRILQKMKSLLESDHEK